MRPTLLQDVFWVSGPTLQCVVAAMIIYRRLLKEIPVFWCYTVFHVLLAVTSYAASQISYRAYFDVYWGAEFLDMLLTLLVVQELFSHTFVAYKAIRAFGRTLFRSAALAMILFSVMLASFGNSGPTSTLVDTFVSFERIAQVLEIGVLFVLFLVCRIFGIVLQRFTFGIAVGTALALAGTAIASALRAFLGSRGDQFYAYLEPASYTLAIAVWTYYAVSVDREAEFPSSNESPAQLTEWNRALEHLLSKS